MTLTMQSFMDAAKLVRDIETSTGRQIYPTPFNGIQVFQDHNALADTTERNFPVSKHRSARIRKKLIKRFGGEFRKEPAIFQFQGCIIAHPARYAELVRQFKPRPAAQSNTHKAAD